MITISFVFDHRGRTPKDSEGPIEFRITSYGRVRYIATGIRCLKKNFKQGVIIDRYDAEILNERLRIMKSSAERYINECLAQNRDFNLSLIKSKLQSLDVNAKNEDFLEWCENQVPILPTSAERKKHYDTLLRVLVEFGKVKSWADVTLENILKFDAYLHDRKIDFKNGESRPLEQSTIYNYHKNLKALLNLAVKMDKLEKNPYAKLLKAFSRGEKESIEYLSEEEMKRIEELPLRAGELKTARDLFVIQMYTGLAYSDLQQLDLTIFKLERGKWVNTGQRMKTGVAFVAHLLPPVVRVLTEYGWKVPQMANQHYNESLRIIGQAAGISTRMHSHLARHTFATYMLRNGVKPENLQKMLGHKRVTQSLHYAKVLAMSVHDDFDMIEKLMKRGGNRRSR